MKRSFQIRNFTLLAAQLAAICKGASEGPPKKVKPESLYKNKMTNDIRQARWDASGFSDNYTPVLDAYGDITQLGENGRAAFVLKVKNNKNEFFAARLCKYDGTCILNEQVYKEFMDELKQLEGRTECRNWNWCRNFPGVLQFTEVRLGAGSIMRLASCDLEFNGYDNFNKNIISFFNGLVHAINVQHHLNRAKQVHLDAGPGNCFQQCVPYCGKAAYEFNVGDYSFQRSWPKSKNNVLYKDYKSNTGSEHKEDGTLEKTEYPIQTALGLVYGLYLVRLHPFAIQDAQESSRIQALDPKHRELASVGIFAKIAGTIHLDPMDETKKLGEYYDCLPEYETLKDASQRFGQWPLHELQQREPFKLLLEPAQNLLMKVIQIKLDYALRSTEPLNEVLKSLILNLVHYEIIQHTNVELYGRRCESACDLIDVFLSWTIQNANKGDAAIRCTEVMRAIVQHCPVLYRKQLPQTTKAVEAIFRNPPKNLDVTHWDAFHSWFAWMGPAHWYAHSQSIRKWQAVIRERFSVYAMAHFQPDKGTNILSQTELEALKRFIGDMRTSDKSREALRKQAIKLANKEGKTKGQKRDLFDPKLAELLRNQNIKIFPKATDQWLKWEKLIADNSKVASADSSAGAKSKPRRLLHRLTKLDATGQPVELNQRRQPQRV